MAKIKAASFDDRLTLVEHLDELRTRLIVTAVVILVAAGLCFWQNELLLDLANRPLPGGFEPLTFSPTEPFMTTLTVTVYAALLLSLPVILWQAYAFVLPAFTPNERRVALPLMLMVPVLFVGGVAFGYFIVAPAATNFLLHFNDEQFNVQIRAREYYGFLGMALISIGVLFQIPVGVLAATRLGIVTPQQLAKNRRYAIAVIALVSMLLPGGDPITMIICMIPLLLLYEGSILLARIFGHAAEPPLEPDAAAEGRS